MRIKKQDSNIVLNISGKSVLLAKNNKLKHEDYSVIVDTTGSLNNLNSTISTPGEYEMSDILFNVFAYGERLDSPEMVFIDSEEDIRVLYISSAIKSVNKAMIEKLPEIHILIAELKEESIKSISQIISDIEPSIFLPLVDNGAIQDLAKELGIGSIDSIPSLNIGQKDFTEASSELKVYILKD